MIKITETNQRNGRFTLPSYQNSTGEWHARNESTFVEILQESITIQRPDIYDNKTARELLYKFYHVDPEYIVWEEVFGIDDSNWIYDLANQHGWDKPLYRADFITEEGEYFEEPITEFEAYKAFLEYVSPGVIIEVDGKKRSPFLDFAVDLTNQHLITLQKGY
jgi:hypothetical protein